MEIKNPEFPSQKQALTIIIITMLLTFISGLVAAFIGLNRTQLLLFELFTIVPALIFVVRNKFSAVLVFRLRPVNLKIIVMSIFIGFSLTVIADELDRLIQLIFPMPDILLKALEETLKIQNTTDLIIVILSAVLMAAICEELLFRGFLQTSLENTFDITRAIMLTALLFAIVHFNPWWTIQLILFAVFLGVMAWKSNSIIPSIIAHLINNGVALIFNNVDKSHLEWYFWRNHVDPYIIGLAGLLLIFGFKKFYRYCDENKEQKSKPPYYSPG